MRHSDVLGLPPHEMHVLSIKEARLVLAKLV